ncbi:stage II sporulation protein R [Orenia marismortui]|uniref:Stage II sporulation protein R n=1 Tax=Orenia marismortui TaxID=46469 RepID=A0A4R8HB89_9FIRM|nr:stage II sporulation protein R [Orenia marismortui]TDX52979.1 stage II sporulation protein R [Orenia marismortui]
MRRVRFVILVVIIISTFFIIGMKHTIVLDSTSLNNYTKDQLLRLHVVANSNSLEDQKIKREVRDAIIKNSSKFFVSLDNPFQAEAIVKKHLPDIKEIITKKLIEHNKDYDVNLKLNNFYFPTRSYGNETLESGKYKALKVILGEGNGENWWCVLFPPLCFVDSMDESSKKELEELAAENKQLTSKEMDIEFKFKFVEFIRENPKFVKSKLKLVHILETSFPNLNKLLFPAEDNNKSGSN